MIGSLLYLCVSRPHIMLSICMCARFQSDPKECHLESVIRLADNLVEHSRTKHIDIQHHFLRDRQQREDINVCHIRTENQLANIFTKPLDEKRFCRLRSELNVLDLQNLD
jgi:predicted metallo-beta-lactamase superfamily hydrolase